MFIKKLIPHVFMSKDEFPPTLTSEMVLHQTFEFMEEWKSRLYDMLSFNTAQVIASQLTATSTHLLFIIFLQLAFLFRGSNNLLVHTAPKGCKIVPLIRSQCLLQLQLSQQKR